MPHCNKQFHSSAPYSLQRLCLYPLLWIISAIVLGTTAWRVHYTKDFLDSNGQCYYEPIIIELLVSACLTILWVPVAMHLIFASSITSLTISMWGERILWLFWLVGAAVTSHKFPLPTDTAFVTTMFDVIIGFAWTAWALLSIIGVLALMCNAALGAGLPVTGPKGAQKIESMTESAAANV